jgi:hypothetical protein
MPRMNRKNKQNGSRVKTGNGFSYRVYCPDCPPIDMGHPERNIHVSVDGTRPPTFVTCINGHRIKVKK